MSAVNSTAESSEIEAARRLRSEGALAAAADVYLGVLRDEPGNAEAVADLGMLRLEQHDYAEAEPLLARAADLKPGSGDLHANLGRARAALGQIDAAISSFEAAAALDPTNATIHLALGQLSSHAGRYREAERAYSRALEVLPDSIDARLARIGVYIALKQFPEALEDCAIALGRIPGHPAVLEAQGGALLGAHRTQEAINSFEAAAAIDRQRVGPIIGIASCLIDLCRHREAIDAIGPAIEAHGNNAQLWALLGLAYAGIGIFDRAAEAYKSAVRLAPGWVQPASALRRLRRLTCDWSPREANLDHTIHQPGPPDLLEMLYVEDDPARQLVSTQAHMMGLCSPRPPLWSGERYGHRILKVGYISGDFGDHPVGHAVQGVLRSHDRRQVEVFAFSHGAGGADATQNDIRQCVEAFVDMGPLSDEAAARCIREREIDVLVDLSGYTLNGRPGILAYRPAPVQANWLGNPGTMGAECYDYIIADSAVIPAEQARHYSEQVVYLSNSFLPYDPARRVAGVPPSRGDERLPPDSIVLACFNNPAKITEDMFATWMRILAALPNSVLWLRVDNAEARRNLRRQSVIRGIDPDRLIFAEKAATPDHLARHALADLFLDTYPYNGGTTTSDALWAGAPVLTYAGRSFYSRMGASLLRAVAMPDLVATSMPAYESRAIEIARSHSHTAELRQRIARGRADSDLFKPAYICRELENAYAVMQARLGKPRGGEPILAF